MRPIRFPQRWFAATVLMLASSGLTVGQEGVVRMSDADTRPGVVKMNAVTTPTIHRTAHATPHPAAAYAMNGAGYGHQFPAQATEQPHQNVYRPTNPYQTTAANAYLGHSFAGMQQASYTAGGHAFGCDCQSQYGSCGCSPGGCCEGGWDGCGQEGCNDYACRGGRRQMRKSGCDDCFYGDGYNDRMVTLFARAVPKDPCDERCWPARWWRGQQYSYLARNQRLSDCLFGWLIPSGCCGQGCPPVGKYCVTYADDPGYCDSRDGGGGGYGAAGGGNGPGNYGVQGYGVPMTVPLAPNVRQSYNYSWGTPSSRITQMGNYSGTGGTPQQLYHQTW